MDRVSGDPCHDRAISQHRPEIQQASLRRFRTLLGKAGVITSAAITKARNAATLPARNAAVGPAT